MSNVQSFKWPLHQPVLLSEVLNALNISSEGLYVDCTFGRGGHSQAILKCLGLNGQLLALDQDPEAIRSARTLQTTENRLMVQHSPFTKLRQHIEEQGWLGQVNGLLLDLGVSSPQLDCPERGFSFLQDGPLDMRMNPEVGESVGKWLSKASRQEIEYVLKTYGEERYANRIAQAITQSRQQKPLQSTAQLADIIATAHPAWEPYKHPATRSFQALRIFINRELEQLQHVLPQTLGVLAPRGRLVVMSFHSLEDRIVKRFIRQCARGDDFPRKIPVPSSKIRPRLRAIGKPIFPTATEIAANPRARSAVLRIAERC